MTPCDNCPNSLVGTVTKCTPWVSVILLSWMSWLSLQGIASAKSVEAQGAKITYMYEQFNRVLGSLEEQEKAFNRMAIAFGTHVAVNDAEDKDKDKKTNE